ncbi:MAG: antitoxin [Gammaproteobacteria bacterium RIFCSPHIGHO2_12_FULL_41_15]|nr:MAG: antitoxin [Gammaproteobacteria bacterium RIFCSPHIGHO2_12_FULL_41_15]
MRIKNIHEAKTQLSKLLEAVSHGEVIIIAKAGKPIAKLVPFYEASVTREPGYWRGKVLIKEDFDELPEDLMNAFKGE